MPLCHENPSGPFTVRDQCLNTLEAFCFFFAASQQTVSENMFPNHRSLFSEAQAAHNLFLGNTPIWYRGGIEFIEAYWMHAFTTWFITLQSQEGAETACLFRSLTAICDRLVAHVFGARIWLMRRSALVASWALLWPMRSHESGAKLSEIIFWPAFYLFLFGILFGMLRMFRMLRACCSWKPPR